MRQPRRGIRTRASELARRGLFEAKTVVARYPTPALAIARRRHGAPVGDDTQVVIEGFPRTGTSFAVAAFDLAQDGSVRIGCHVHAPAMVIEGARRGLPNLVIVREPEQTVLSFVIRNPHISIRQALRGYLRFYEPLLALRDRFVVGTFDEVTSDFGAVIRHLNGRFGTTFREFEHTEENVARCFAAIEEDYRMRVPDGESFERQVARPSAWRDTAKEGIRSSYWAPDAARLRTRGVRAFRLLTDAG